VEKNLRRLFHAAACVSAILLLATLILCPVSYYHYASVMYVVGGETEYRLGDYSGRAVLEYQKGWGPAPSGYYFYGAI